MQLGIFAKTFPRPRFEEALDAAHAQGLDCVQFNMACTGLPPLPDRIDPELCDRIHAALASRDMQMGAISGTFNMIHPDPEMRRDGLWKLRTLASACRRMGTSRITLCTGTRHPTDMWAYHRESSSPEAWNDLVESMREAVRIAQETNVTLAFEPEVSNVVDSAAKARRLLDEIGSPRLKVVMDAANLFHRGELGRMREVLDQAFELLGKDIVVAHAKDLSRDGEAGHEAAGTGVLDYDHYLSLLHAVEFTGPLILHGLSEAQVAGSVSFLRAKLASQQTLH